MNFIDFKQAIAKQFALMQQYPLYRTEAPKDGLWDKYLGSFPDGTNPMFRERTEHDCTCCKQFIRSIGNVVAIKEGKIVSIWDSFMLEDTAYNVVAAALEHYVKSFKIDNVFTHDQPTAGTDKNFEDLLEGKVQVWNHFFVNIPAKYVNRYPGTFLGEQRGTFDVLKRSLETISMDAVDTVIELIDQNSLYKGQENRYAVSEFKKLKEIYNDINAQGKDLLVWLQVSKNISQAISRIRNTSIGTLLVALSDGEPLDDAVKKFEAMVAPTNYKRPTALVTKAMIEAAKKTVEDLGLTSALERRYAKLTDITINNVIFANRSTRKAISGNVFDDLVASKVEKIKNLDRVDDVTIEQFIEHILPNAESIEVMMSNSHVGNLMSLIAPMDPTAKQLFKWGNDFSWTYNGDVADSMKERVKKAGGSVTGELCCRLAWEYTDDLDFHMREPNGGHIYFRDRRSRLGGFLDVDANGGSGMMDHPVENIVYETLKTMKDGEYILEVNNWSRRSSGVGFEVEIDVHGTVHHFVYDKVIPHGVTIKVANLQKIDGTIFITPYISSTKSVKQVWGINTNTFQKVSAIMLSPNYWDGKGVGNKHFFFMIEGCANDGTARGFYNEFLRSELDAHRKTLEMVGGKLRTDESDQQLSGLGFSSTQRNSIICRVTGSFTRIINITF